MMMMINNSHPAAVPRESYHMTDNVGLLHVMLTTDTWADRQVRRVYQSSLRGL